MNENNFDEFPPQILSLTQLSWLYLRDNRIETIPEEIRKLKKLSELWLGGNPIKELPREALQSLKSLKYLGINK